MVQQLFAAIVEEIAAAKQIEATRRQFRNWMLGTDFVLHRDRLTRPLIRKGWVKRAAMVGVPLVLVIMAAATYARFYFVSWIGERTVATFHYTLTDAAGKVIDTSDGRAPLSYLHGAGNIIAGLENALAGKQAGDKLGVVKHRVKGDLERFNQRFNHLQDGHAAGCTL